MDPLGSALRLPRDQSKARSAYSPSQDAPRAIDLAVSCACILHLSFIQVGYQDGLRTLKGPQVDPYLGPTMDWYRASFLPVPQAPSGRLGRRLGHVALQEREPARQCRAMWGCKLPLGPPGRRFKVSCS